MMTIIILLILIGVTIAAIMGDKGLINKLKNAGIKTALADIKEEIQTDILEAQIVNNGDISDDILENILEKYGTLSEEGQLIDKTLTTTKGKIKVSDIYNGPTVKPIVANAPNINGFNKNNTYYVTWDLTNSPYTINESTLIS